MKRASAKSELRRNRRVVRTYDRVFATVCEQRYFKGLWSLLNSIYAYHQDELRVFVGDCGLSEEQRVNIQKHPLEIEIIAARKFAFPTRGPWEAKQQLFAELLPVAKCVLMLDCDLVITSRMDDVFQSAEKGNIVSSKDGIGIEFDNSFRVYNDGIVGRKQTYINTGALCLDTRKHWDLVGLFAYTSQYGTYTNGWGEPLSLPGHGDQGIFNALCNLLGKTASFDALAEEEWCDSTLGCSVSIRWVEDEWTLDVTNGRTNCRQRLIHSSGPKWWTLEGRNFLRDKGEKLAIFEHFYGLIPLNRVSNSSTWARSLSPNIVIGVCSYASNRRSRDSIRATWAANVPPNCTVVFFIGKAPESSDEKDIVTLDVEDGYSALPRKVQAFLKWAVQNTDAEFFFKCDDDTYLVVERLCQLIFVNADMVGDRHVETHGWASGGAGYWINRPGAEALSNAKIPPHGPEDVILSKIAILYDLTMASDARLRSDTRVFPSPTNDFISAHGLNPAAMREAHEHFS